MRGLVVMALILAVLIGCASPEATRKRAGGPGADVGNRTKIVQIHEGSKPFDKTPQIIHRKHTAFAAVRGESLAANDVIDRNQRTKSQP
ncbi:MAG: hypothetical protein HY695_04530 [Deltaproteobacteria bacterium]|nr:hypothetical protein [Deltaproteobacteria bacterium]